MFNFIEQLINYTIEAESPTEFWRWASIACLASILRDNVYLECSIGPVHPNLYVILLSDSGIARKAAPCKFVGKLIQQIGNTKFISGRASMQAVIRELGKGYTNENGDIISGAAGLLYSEELSSFMVDDPATVPLLIDLYDYHERWATNLISYTGTLKSVCLSLLAASNSDLFKSTFTDQAIKGGLLGRSLIIKAEKPRHRKSLLELAIQEDSVIKLKLLITHLKRISRIKGLIKFYENAEKEYNSWYHSIPEDIFIDRIGFGSRLGTHVAKIAISLGAAREDFDRWVTLEDVEQSINLCQELRKSYKQLSFGVGAANSSYKCSLIIKAMLTEKNYHITRVKLIQRTFGDLDNIDELDKLLVMMVQGGLIEERGLNNEVGYKLSKKGIDLLIGGNHSNE